MDFKTAVSTANNFKTNKDLMSKITEQDMLLLYGLYKQATEGDCNTEQPWAIQVKDRAKWNAWDRQRGKSKKTVESMYCVLVANLLKRYGKN